MTPQKTRLIAPMPTVYSNVSAAPFSISLIGSPYCGRPFEETMEQYEARTADRCETGKWCCALMVLEAEYDFRIDIKTKTAFEDKRWLWHISIG